MRISVDGVEYYVKRVGKGEAVVLLHGFTGNHATWSETAYLLSKSYQCIMIDLLGHGKSDSPHEVERYSFESCVQDIQRILCELGIEKTHIIGYSLGGRLALGFAVMFPSMISSLILESTSPGLQTEQERSLRREDDENLAWKIRHKGLSWFVDYWENIPLFQSQKSLPQSSQLKIRRQRLSNNLNGLRNSLLGMGTGRQPSYWGDLSKLSFPVFLMAGRLDEKFCSIARKMNNHLLYGSLCQVENAGHAIHVEQSQKFGTIVEEFLFNT
ncbi:2-succinyl-6-hydroxy-2,4-cyclohexadiene-1-carboxylate synthase [Bacillus sp. 2205SS5-2]|uniref:2-succinyl-6-hydroxy-2, 4-cyclohexadiene-1-carboxylate synthase n=1 Tax=Bacillus sp. 2205SS5-2 TaxID=3109031 RepID=UPI003FA5B36B